MTKPELHQLGIGKAIALGRGNLTGDYKKNHLGLQNDDAILLLSN
jgi:hypothetical protein